MPFAQLGDGIRGFIMQPSFGCVLLARFLFCAWQVSGYVNMPPGTKCQRTVHALHKML
jgi:hypothetical protein